MNLLTGRKVYPIDLIENIPKKIAAHHPILYTTEDIGDDFALTSLLPITCQTAQIGKQPPSCASIWENCDLLPNEGKQLIPYSAP